MATKLYVPFIQFGDRRGLTTVQIFNNEFVREFVERFRDRFEFNAFRDAYLFIESTKGTSDGKRSSDV